MAEEEKKRIEEQRTQLGEKGLAEKAKQLDEAMEFNEVCFIKNIFIQFFISNCLNNAHFLLMLL